MATIYSIVEGHGEVASVPVLLRRIGAEVAPSKALTCLRPHRLPRTQLLDGTELGHALGIAIKRLRASAAPHILLLLMDSDGDSPDQLVNQLRSQYEAQFSTLRHSIVFAVQEFEAWFLAANMTQAFHPDLRTDCPVIGEPEQVADAKGVFTQRFVASQVYTSSVDQVRFASTMDLQAARRAPSFDKLWREIETLLRA